ncbi:conserved hypothetical protein [Citreicella sp. SE45]|nr:conserved hypothetical protein [Citreicella sp. SE45]
MGVHPTIPSSRSAILKRGNVASATGPVAHRTKVSVGALTKQCYPVAEGGRSIAASVTRAKKRQITGETRCPLHASHTRQSPHSTARALLRPGSARCPPFSRTADALRFTT